MAIDRGRGSRARVRWALGLVALGVVGLAFAAAWRALSLDGLPDIGDPFDVEAFVDVKVADSDNAYVLYKEAVARLGQEPPNANLQWSTTGPLERRWLEESRPAMEIWRHGTERPGAQCVSPAAMTVETQLPVVQSLRSFLRLARLEGSRLEAEGDMEGAWGWYRAIYRTGRHISRRSTMIERAVGAQFHTVATNAMIRWAADPRVDSSTLRKALDAAIADDSMRGPVSDNLKVEYLAFAHTYDDPELMLKCLLDEDTAPPGRFGRLGRNRTALRLQRVILKEPERSRRVLRLVFANVLAWADLPPDRRPPVAGSIPNPNPASSVKTLMDLRAVDASAPAGARALPPDELARWFGSTLYARQLLPAFAPLDNVSKNERAAQANLVITLANKLFERDRGKPPETVEELVGPYLKSLPDGYSPPR